MINLFDATATGCAQSIKDNESLVAMTLDPMSSEPILIHHLTQIRGSLSQDTACLVSLSGFGSQAHAVCSQLAATFFEHAADHAIPDLQEILSAATSKNFSDLEADVLQVGRFRNLVLLTPFLAAAIVADHSLLPSDLTVVVVATSTNMESSLEDSDGFDVHAHDTATAYILSFYGTITKIYLHLLVWA